MCQNYIVHNCISQNRIGQDYIGADELPVRSLVHAAADVSFTQPLQEATTTIVNGTLQMLDLAAGTAT